jgi:hypothetical protein
MSRKQSMTDTKRLLLESGGICAFPGCQRGLVTPDSDIENGAIIAEMAHIVADSREGPRGKLPMDQEQRGSHENQIVLCPEHHKVIDSQPRTYSIQVLQQMKMDHLAVVRRKLHPEIEDEKPTCVEETIQSSGLCVSHLPQAVYEAKCAFGPGEDEEVRSRIVVPQDHEVLLPFVLGSGKIYCFQNLSRRSNPFSSVIDSGSVRPLMATQMWSNENDKRLYVRLLNRSLYKYTGHRGVRFDGEHRRFFFIPDEVGKARLVKYESLAGRNVQRNVVWEPVRKKTGLGVGVWWHVAADLRFHHVAPLQWCLSIRPEWHLTKDGSMPLESKRIGRRVTSKKSRMFNDGYLKEINFWQDFLSDGKPRIVLNFDDQSAVIQGEALSFIVQWPGIPGDAMTLASDARAEDLFTLAELHEATSGDDVEWDEEEDEVEELEEDDDY